MRRDVLLAESLEAPSLPALGIESLTLAIGDALAPKSKLESVGRQQPEFAVAVGRDVGPGGKTRRPG